MKLPPLVGGQAESWAALVELAPKFGRNWLLVGGQLVFLHEVEREAKDVRPTDDVDVVVDVRTEPAGLARIHDVLTSARFAQDPPSPDGTAHRYRRGGAVIDVLAPDNVGERARLDLGSGHTIEAPGTTQAFRRSATVDVEIGDQVAAIQRPDLIGALIGKAAAVVKISSQTKASRAKHLRDFASLARMIGPEDRTSAELSRNERKLLSTLGEAHELDELAEASLAALLRNDHEDGE